MKEYFINLKIEEGFFLAESLNELWFFNENAGFHYSKKETKKL